MDTGGTVTLVLVLLGLGYLSVATLRVTLRGGPGPGDPPASHPRVDPAGFPVAARPHRDGQRRSRRARTAAAAAAVHTARERATARGTSAVAGGRPSPSAGRSSTRLP
ncbi:hypothetical protein SAMN04515665_102156 [Blastococcus sp. DSM 46786]|nr:hypothetical protein SAMN04515665_102156 [Blastococcus sp. DSM 46786]